MERGYSGGIVYTDEDIEDPIVRDFQELLIARGFTVNGQFRSYEEMTFSEKKGIDLLLEPILQRGRRSLSIVESLSKEQIWIKNIDIPLNQNREDAYLNFFQTVWKYLDPEEMKIVKEQAEKIRKKKVY
ncbi:MAG: hypothetical protein V1749_03155 [Candidatus Desantisbacteria bacterium]